MKKLLVTCLSCLFVISLVGCDKIKLPFGKNKEVEQIQEVQAPTNPVVDVLSKVDSLEKFNNIDYITGYKYTKQKDTFIVESVNNKVIENNDQLQVKCEARGHLDSDKNIKLIIEVPYTEKHKKDDEIQISYMLATNFDTEENIYTDIKIIDEEEIETEETDETSEETDEENIEDDEIETEESNQKDKKDIEDNE